MSGIMSMLLGAVSSAAAAVDEFFNRVTLLLPGNGTNGAQNNTFLDSSTNNFTITRNGNTTQGTFSPFSQTGWSNYFDGTGDTLALPNNAAFAMSNGAFTIEFWFYTDSITQTGYILQTDINSTALYVSFSSSTLRLTDAGTVYVSTPTLVANTWNHIAVVRSGTGSNQTVIYTNGVAGTAGTCAQSFTQSGPVIGGNGYLGYISNLRIVKGSAVYTSGFTPPTAPLTNITNTSLLTCQSNRFVDNSTANSGSGFAITVNGNTSVQAFSPFVPTVAYGTETIGGSGYFDGTGDYLSVASNTALTFGTGDFTVEGWFYANALGGQPTILNNGSDAAGLVITLVSSKIYAYFVGAGNVFGSSGATIVTNTWYHFAWVRSGSTHTFYLNGAVYGTTYSSAGNHSSTGGVGIGYSVAGTAFAAWNGYIADVRMVKGTAVYTGAFTPPIAPVGTSGPASSYSSTTNVNTTFTSTNTSLLTNFTNAGITDATAKNVLETVGNAQISTTQSKFGGSSISFDGTGDNLVIPSSPNVWFGSGAFSIEMWLYPNNASSEQMLLSGNDTGSLFLGMNIDGANRIALGRKGVAVDNFVSYTYSTGAWIYLAVTRDSSNNIKFFVNGSQVGSTGTNANSFTNSVMNIGFEPTQKYLNGYIDDLRITKGIARTITASPTAAFPLQ